MTQGNTGAPPKISRRSAVDPFIVMDVMRAAGEYARRAAVDKLPDVVHMEVGQPSTPAPRRAREAAAAALEAGPLGYTDALGDLDLRRRIARHYADFYRCDLAAERIAVTTGSSGGFLLAFLAAFDPGDRVALASPGYPCYRHILSVLGIAPVLIETQPETKFQPTPALLDALAGKIDGLIVASPSNPVGAMVSPQELEALARWCDAHGVRLISDEIYHGISYGMTAATAAQFSDHAIVVNSFSKYFSMTGWRLGWLGLPPDLVRPVERLAQNLFISPPAVSQAAGLAAFDATEELDANVRRYAANRALLLEELPKAGFTRLTVPDGAFYIYADVADFTSDSLDFSKRMLAETGVAATPGLDFDPARGSHFMRFSFAGSTADMAEAARRLKAWHNKVRRL
ncbi:pyridoxal phosphate-dependent aminotransferase [Dongia sedimenti]|uniref:Aminotransferase n=1 Tax=Dongia sedimenti TaxID=3064282 RepID=A0ABU0YWE5_9PROT|nr:aminotransferase class I/II-fold pyridoxal phosphate-dependent enzyme [Rhodospirillaceae bacterium R-7]